LKALMRSAGGLAGSCCLDAHVQALTQTALS
jgi:hypothetical protein